MTIPFSPLSVFAGVQLAKSVGVTDSPTQLASGLLASTAGGIVGVVLARQFALSRAPAPPIAVSATPSATPAAATPPAAPTATAPAPGTPPAPAAPPPLDPSLSNASANRMIDQLAHAKGVERDAARAEIVTYLRALTTAVDGSTPEPDDGGGTTPSNVGVEVLRDLLTVAEYEARHHGHDSPCAVISYVAHADHVKFDGSESSADAGGTIQAWEWHFGDGSSASGAKAKHRYAAPGTYCVRLKVRDSWGGTHSSSREIAIGGAAQA